MHLLCFFIGGLRLHCIHTNACYNNNYRLRTYFQVNIIYNVYAIEDFIDNKPMILHKENPYTVSIGTRGMICLDGTSGGTNGTNYWMINDIMINVTDISEFTGESTSYIAGGNLRPAICSACSCFKKDYLEIDAVENVLESELEKTGYASFLVTLYSVSSDLISAKARLCYGVPKMFISVLIMKEVRFMENPLDGQFTITSTRNISLSEDISIETGKDTRY